jgi:hypothetical protein
MSWEKLPSLLYYLRRYSVIRKTAYKRGGCSSLIILQRMSQIWPISVLIATSASSSSAALLLKVWCYCGTFGEYVCKTALITFSRTVIGGVVMLTASSISCTSGQKSSVSLRSSLVIKSNFYLARHVNTSKALAARLILLLSYASTDSITKNNMISSRFSNS